MRQTGLDEEAAYLRLQKTARNENQKLVDADWLEEIGQIYGSYAIYQHGFLKVAANGHCCKATSTPDCSKCLIR